MSRAWRARARCWGEARSPRSLRACLRAARREDRRPTWSGLDPALPCGGSVGRWWPSRRRSLPAPLVFQPLPRPAPPPQLPWCHAQRARSSRAARSQASAALRHTHTPLLPGVLACPLSRARARSRSLRSLAPLFAPCGACSGDRHCVFASRRRATASGGGRLARVRPLRAPRSSIASHTRSAAALSLSLSTLSRTPADPIPECVRWLTTSRATASCGGACAAALSFICFCLRGARQQQKRARARACARGKSKSARASRANRATHPPRSQSTHATTPPHPHPPPTHTQNHHTRPPQPQARPVVLRAHLVPRRARGQEDRGRRPVRRHAL